MFSTKHRFDQQIQVCTNEVPGVQNDSTPWDHNLCKI